MNLLFVYNVNSGKLNTLFNIGLKLFSPNTYKSNLCALTFDTFSENNIWETFREESKIAMEFFHINEFKKAFPDEKFEYPIILKKDNTRLKFVFIFT